MIKSCSVDDFLVRKALFVLSVLKIYFHIYQKNFCAQFLHQPKTNCERIKIMLVQIFDRLTDSEYCVMNKRYFFLLTLFYHSKFRLKREVNKYQ